MENFVRIASSSNKEMYSCRDRLCKPSLSNAAGNLICVGSDLFANGYNDEALAMFDAAYNLIQRFQGNDLAVPGSAIPKTYWNMVSNHVVMGTELLGRKRRESARRKQLHKHNDLDALCTSEQRTYSSDHTNEPADLYQEDECDIGPRVLNSPMKLDVYQSDLLSSEARAVLIEAIILFNKGLICQSKEQAASAKELYEVVVYGVQQLVGKTVSGRECALLLGMSFLELCLRVYNNLGVLHYCEHKENLASSFFELSLQFATRLMELRSTNNKAIQLQYATILSNWCRVNWMRGDVNDHLYAGVIEVLTLRASLLSWDHPDVAAAHYNVAVAEYARQDSEKAKSHLMQYLSVASHRKMSSRSEVTNTGSHVRSVNEESYSSGDLDPIPALIFLLLIQNEDKEDHMSQDLVRGLRTLQDKRQDQGPNSFEVASVLNFIGTILFHKNEFESSLMFFEEELRLEDNSNRTQSVGASSEYDALSTCTRPDDTSVSVTCNNIGRILQELKRYPEAIYFYQRALKSEYGDILALRLKSGGKCCNSPSLALSKPSPASAAHSKSSANLFSTVWYNLGLIHDKLRSYDEAIFAFEMSLELRKALLGDDHPDIACLQYNIGVLQMEQSRLSEAAASFKEALRIRLSGAAGQLNDKHVVKTLEKLVALYKAKGNCAGALEVLEEILRIQLITPEFDNVQRLAEMGASLRLVSELYQTQGNLDVAVKAAKASVYKFRMAAEFRAQQIVAEIIRGNTYAVQLSQECAAEAEQHVSSLLLLGSLYHEVAEPMDAVLVFQEAAKAVELQQQRHEIAGTKSASLNALKEVTGMLAHCHCAPTA